MSDHWFILSRRYGEDLPNPSLEELQSAIREVYEENIPGMTLADYEEHPSAFVRWGTDTGPMCVLYIERSRSARLEQWSDQDFSDELAIPLTIHGVSQQEALEFWLSLRSGQIESLSKQFELRGTS